MKKECLSEVVLVSAFIFLWFGNNSFGQIKRIQSFSEKSLMSSVVTEKDGIEYCQLSYNSLPAMEKIGEPELPVKYLRLLISSEESVSGITVNNKSQKIPIDQRIHLFRRTKLHQTI